MTTRLPSLGPRGEGWVVAQFILLFVIGGLGLRDLAGAGWASAWGPVAVAIGTALILAGLVLAARAARDLRSGLSPFPHPVAGAPLVETGLYGRIRHPIYSGLLLAAVGWSVVTASVLALIAAALLALVLDVKARREEAWLLRTHPSYSAYRARTKRFLPGLY